MISIVIPTFNERESLTELYQELSKALQSHELEAEFIFIDDGSTDGSWQLIQSLASTDRRVRGFRFRTNFGKAIALNVGFAEARGELLFTLDADLQDDPMGIPPMLALLQKDWDMVAGWKKRRHDPWHKVYPSRIFNWLVGFITGVKLHDHNCGIKGYRREVLQHLHLYGELHRFIPVMAHAKGFRVTEVEVNHRPRTHGHSKYGARRFLHGILDLITIRFLTGYGDRPLHLLGLVGVTAAVAGLLGLAYLAVLWLMGEGPIGNRPLLFYSLAALIVGSQMITFGMLAELIIWQTAQRNGVHDRSVPVAERTDGILGTG